MTIRIFEIENHKIHVTDFGNGLIEITLQDHPQAKAVINHFQALVLMTIFAGIRCEVSTRDIVLRLQEIKTWKSEKERGALAPDLADAKEKK